MNGHWARLLGYFVAMLVAIAAIVLAPMLFDGWMPEQSAEEAGPIDALFWGLIWLSVILLALVMAIVGYSMVHFRARPGDDSDGAPIHGNHKLELFWTIIPTIIVVVIGIVSYVVLVDQERAPAKGQPASTVWVRAFSFGWKFAHSPSAEQQPEGLPEANELVVPVGSTTRFEVISCSGREEEKEPTQVSDEEHVADEDFASQCVERYGELEAPPSQNPDGRAGNDSDVNHAFWVPETRMKIDAVAGLGTWTQWTAVEPSEPGDREQVVCAELCGTGHYAMRADACFVEPAVHEWYLEKLGEGPDPEDEVSCATLRYFSCSEGETDYDDLRSRVEELLAANDNATCEDLEGAA